MAHGSPGPNEYLGQQELADFSDVSRQVHLRERASLSSMLKPESWGVSVGSYATLANYGETAIEAADPQLLEQSLIDVPPPRRMHGYHGSAVSYPDYEKNREVFVSLTPTEYQLVPRDVKSLARATINKTLAVRPIHKPQTRPAAERSALHALTGKYNAIDTYVTETLEPDRKLLEKFQTAAQHPNLSLFGPEVSLRIALSTYERLLAEALEAVGSERQWSPEQFKIAKQASEWRILFMRGHNEHIGNFQKLTGMLYRYNGAKLAVFRSRMYQIKPHLKQTSE